MQTQVATCTLSRACEFFNIMKDRPKNCRMRVQRLPTAYLLPIVARTENSALPLNGQLSDKIHHSSWPRKCTTDPSSLDMSSRARRCFACRLRRKKRLRCAVIAFSYRHLPAGFIAPCLPIINYPPAANGCTNGRCLLRAACLWRMYSRM
jgi:hypothetical protein